MGTIGGKEIALIAGVILLVLVMSSGFWEDKSKKGPS